MTEFKVTSLKVLPGDSGYLIETGKSTILCDSGFGFTGEAMVKKIEEILQGRSLDYIFLTHSHYDHVLGSMNAKKRWPDAKIVAHEYAAKIFTKPGAREVMRNLDRAFALENGVSEYEDLIDTLQVDIAVSEGDIIKTNDAEFEVISLPGHTRCCIGFFCRKNKFLISCESLGTYGSADVIMPSYLIGYKEVIESIQKVKALNAENILVPHFGVISGEFCEKYVQKAECEAIALKDKIVKEIENGKTDEEIIEVLRDKYFKDYIKEIYPPKAFALNTSISIALIRREFCSAE